MRTQLAEQRLLWCGDALADNRNPQPGNRWTLRWQRRPQTLRISERRRAKGIQLVGRPEIRRELLDKLRWRVYPIELFELRGKMDLSESFEPILDLFGRKRVQISKFPLERFALRGKLEIVIDGLSQQAWQKTQWQPLERSEFVRDKFSCF